MSDAANSTMPVGNDYDDIRDAVRKLCDGFPIAYWQGLENQPPESSYPTAFINALTEAGYLGALIPEAYGGAGLPLRCGGCHLGNHPLHRQLRRRRARPDVYHGHAPAPRFRSAKATILAEDCERAIATTSVRRNRAQHPARIRPNLRRARIRLMAAIASMARRFGPRARSTQI